MAHQTLHGLVEAQAVRTPAARAVVADDAQLTYAELDARAEELADLLAAHGVGPSDLVAVVLDRSPDLVAAMLAILKSGAAYVPIDADYPAERIAYTIEDARPAAVLADRGSAPRLPGGVTPLLVDGPHPTRPTGRPARREVLPDEAAYVVYTSGSTGRPKGVVISHRSIVNYLTWMQTEYPMAPDDRFVQKAPTGFDGAVPEFYLPLSVGAAVVLARPDDDQEPERVAELIARHNVTVAQFVPSMLPVFMNEDLASRCKGIRRVFSASEALSDAVQRQFQHWFAAELVNLYGPTETTVDTASWRCASDPGSAVVPLGHPVRNMRIEVLDADLRRLPPGTDGEIYVSGIQLARGYLNRSGLTAQRFVADPHGAPGERMYRTGDLGRRRADGALEFIGRADDQVKIGGVRIEPAEIEAALVGHPAVRQAAAKAVTTPAGQTRMAAWVIADQSPITAEEIRDYLRARLHEAAVPAYVVFLGELPQNANGKLDRAALTIPDLDPPGAEAHEEPDEFANDTERAFLTIVCDVLGVRSVALDNSFIALGGDSIAAINLAVLAQRAGIGITTGDVLRKKTLGDLLRGARSRLPQAAESDRNGIGPVTPTPIMHWLHQLGGSMDGFSQSMVVRTPAGATEGDLLACLQALLDRHDMLRARFGASHGDGPRQPEVLAPGAVRASSCLEVVDAADVPDGELRTAIRSGLDRSRALLDISTPKLLHAIWYRRGAGRQGRLAVLVNHLVIDGVSLRILQSDLNDAWRTLKETGKPQLAPVTVSFRRWADLLNREALSPRRRKELSYWNSMVGGRPTPIAGRALDPRTDTVATARTRRFSLSPRQTDLLLNRAPAVFGAEVNTLLLTGFAFALAEWHGTGAERDLAVALEGHGRQDVFPGVDPNRTVGWFTTLFPVRLGLDGIKASTAGLSPVTLRRAVDRIGARLAGIPDKGLGFGLLRYLNPETRDRLAAGAMPEIVVNYLGSFQEADEADWAFDAEHDVAPDEMDGSMPLSFAIEVNCLTMPRGDGPVLSAIWTWAAAAVPEETVGRLAELWFARLGDLAAVADGSDAAPDHRTPAAPADSDAIESDLSDFQAF